MDFLTLCNRLRQETGIADSGPSTVTGQTGDMARLVDWINESWLRIQSSRNDWGWMWSTQSDVLSVGVSTYTVPVAQERLIDVVVDGFSITEIPYDTFRTNYRSLNSGRPTGYAVRPDGVLTFNTIPDSAYPITSEAYSLPAYLVNNIDVPGMPERFHMLIVWSALAEYAMFDEAPELIQKARINYEQTFAELVRDQAPPMVLPETIA